MPLFLVPFRVYLSVYRIPWEGAGPGSGTRCSPAHAHAQVFGEAPDWVLAHASKAIMFRSAADPTMPSLLEAAAPSCSFVRGYICSTTDELIIAFGLLREEAGVAAAASGPGPPDAPEYLLVPSAAQGRVSTLVHSLEELRLYDFPLGEVVLQVPPSPLPSSLPPSLPAFHSQ